MQFPTTFPFLPRIFSKGEVTEMSGIWMVIAANATPRVSKSRVSFLSFADGAEGKGKMTNLRCCGLGRRQLTREEARRQERL